jgi:signal transduction histidine kinase
MSRDSTQARSLSIDRYPDPACSYGIENGTPVIRSTNGAFETRFGTDVDGQSVPDAFEALGVRDGSDSLSSLLTECDQFEVQLNKSRSDTGFLVTAVPPEDGEQGFLLFTETEADEPDDGAAGTLEIDHVASVVSHDLRNPLDVAKARLEAGRELDEDEHFDHVEQAHERMERIIQDVLTIARGEEVVEPDQAVDLTDVAETAWETVETDGATLTVDEQLPTATADPDSVGRLFENLFRNAVEHGSTGPAEHSSTGTAEHGRFDVSVTVGPIDGGGFYVADDGPGIPRDDWERVFEPGYSSDDHGTGLGLAIVARIADLHGWSVTVTDAAAGGARIEVSGVDSD